MLDPMTECGQFKLNRTHTLHFKCIHSNKISKLGLSKLLNFSYAENCYNSESQGAIIAQWIRLRLSSCSLGFKSQARAFTIYSHIL